MTRSSFLILALILVAAYSVITVRHENRLTFANLQELETEKNHLQAEWGRLMLEKATWSIHDNIADDARGRLDMKTPAPEDIITIHRGNG